MGIYVGKAPDYVLPSGTPEEIAAENERACPGGGRLIQGANGPFCVYPPLPDKWDAKRYAKRALWLLTNTPRFIWTWIRYLVTGDCGHICGATIVGECCSTDAPYPDFIPECGCPIHDWRDWLF